MAVLKVGKVVGSLPGTLEADTIYAVRTGIGFSLFVSDATGSTAHPINLPAQSNEIIQMFPPTIDATQKQTTTAFPQDDSLPQSGEGTAYAELDTTVTPRFATSNLLVVADLACYSAAAIRAAAGIWRDSGANAIAVRDLYIFQNSGNLIVTAFVAAGSTAATTFKVRFSRSASGTLYLNDFSTPLYGGAVSSHLTVYEIAG